MLTLHLPANVFLPKDRISMAHQGFGFCEFLAEDDAEYAVKIMNQIKLYGKPIRVNKASYDKKQLDVGANLFIGSLDPAADENALYDTFSTFGGIAEHPKVSSTFNPGDGKEAEWYRLQEIHRRANQRGTDSFRIMSLKRRIWLLRI